MSLLTLLMLSSDDQTAGTVTLTNRNAYQSSNTPQLANATYTLSSNGSVSSTGEANGFWIAPQTGMGLFEVRTTLVSGGLSSGQTGTWLSLGTDRSWQCSSSIPPGQLATLTVEIRRIGTTTVLTTATVTITAEVFA